MSGEPWQRPHRSGNETAVDRRTAAARIIALPGDGVGPEVAAEAVRALDAVAAQFGHAFDIETRAFGGAAIDAVGEPLPRDTLEACRAADAVLLGAVGGPKWDRPDSAVRPEQGLLELRRALRVHANLRPVTPVPELAAASPLRPDRLEGVDLLFVRELTGGIYFGEKRRGGTVGERWASDECAYTEQEIARVVRVAAQLARERRGTLTSVDKANVLETSRLWRSVATDVVATEFPDVRLEHMLVDACAMHLLRRPAEFDVIVTENMFGDILTDEASMLAGSIGALPSASLSPEHGGLYEPIHGSAPDRAGTGSANPIGAILSAAMLLRHALRLETEAAAIERAVASVLAAGFRTADIATVSERAVSTESFGREVALGVAPA